MSFPYRVVSWATRISSFTPPAATLGTLYYGRTATTAGTAITSAGSWFNVSSVTTAGAYAMNNVSFVPAAGSSGVVSIPFTALASNGSQYTGTVQVTILSSAQKPGTTTPSKPAKTFPDVPKTEWYYPYVTDLTTSGVLGGYEDGTFAPDTLLTREQMASILYRYARYAGSSLRATADLSQYDDHQAISPWAGDSMRWAVSNRLLTAEDNALRPADTVSRGELAAALRLAGREALAEALERFLPQMSR